ncbi:MAG: CBS domain-containing protein [Nitrososphaera sp.]|jgi:CBS domain-containing protein
MSIEIVPVASVMIRDVKTAKENQSIKVIAKTMVDNGIGSVVIVGSDEENRPAGIVTERDLVKYMAAGTSNHNKDSVTAREIMSKPVITIEPQSSLKDAMQTMQLKDIRRLPVMQRDRLVGIITDKDIFRAIVKSQTLVSSFLSERLVVEYRPMYEKLGEFMQSEILFPDKNQ